MFSIRVDAPQGYRIGTELAGLKIIENNLLMHKFKVAILD